jgi:DNA-binding response OmpR family regulator
VTRILIVNDEPTVLDALAALFVEEGYRVQTAPDGRVALAMIAATPPDLLITDVMMPGLDGWAVLAAVREQMPALPVVVMSAVERREAREREVRITDHTVFLRKPFSLAELLALVERLTGSQPS